MTGLQIAACGGVAIVLLMGLGLRVLWKSSRNVPDEKRGKEQ